MPEITLPNGWVPRPYQMPAWKYLANGGKRAVLVWHRRAGKDDVALHLAACRSMQRPATYWHMLPEATQARRAIWEAVNPHTGKRRIDEAFPQPLRTKERNNEMFLGFAGGSTWQVVGSDNFNSLVGSPPAGVVFSEYALADPQSWGFISPILRENGGWACFISTPRGRNHLHALFEYASNTEGWYAERLAANDTGAFTNPQLYEIEAEYKATFGPEHGQSLFEQEYLCSWDAAVLGAYYGRLLLEAEQDKRITTLPYDPVLPVWTAWDLGISDHMSIWFAQASGGQVRVIDYYEAAGFGLDHYVQFCLAKPYTYAGHLLPHDAQARELGTGKARIEVMEGLGLKNLNIVPQLEVQDGINAVRAVLPRCWFDKEKTNRGLECLRMYRTEWDEKHKTLKPRPVHDWSSHGADAFRYLAVGLDQVAGLRIERASIDRYRQKRSTDLSGGGWMAA